MVSNAATEGTASAGAPGWRCLAMLLAPFLVFAVVLASGPVTTLPDVGGRFGPRPWVWYAAGGLGLLYAAGLVRLLERYRLAKGGQIGARGVRRGIDSFGTVLMVGALVGAWLALTTAIITAARVNEVIGVAHGGPGAVQRKWVTHGKGCHFHVRVVGSMVESGASLCMREARWNRVEVDSTLPLVVTASALGAQVSVGPESSPGMKEHGHE